MLQLPTTELGYGVDAGETFCLPVVFRPSEEGPRETVLSVVTTKGNVLGRTHLTGSGVAAAGHIVARSAGAEDGWVLESGSTSSRGARVNPGGTAIIVGHDASDRQYRGVLSFDTAALPDAAVVVSAAIALKPTVVLGKSPVRTHGDLLLDIRTGAFSGSSVLQERDFQAAASLNRAGTVAAMLTEGWHFATLAAGALPLVNTRGLTQLRLRFARGDDRDAGADNVRFFSGDGLEADRPALIVQYIVP